MTAAIEDIMESNSTEGDQVLLEQFSNCKSFKLPMKTKLGQTSCLWKPH